METRVRFEDVSKLYHLGHTRTSIPVLVRDWMRRNSQGNPEQSFWALRDVSFDLMEGDSLALVGANGAGKTTILKLLANITKPTSGTISAHGKLSALIELGAGFHPDLSGRENIYLNGAILGLRRKEIARRFDEIVDFSELERFIDTPVKRYSSGMTVRLGFAVASCIEPEILLVDEVLAVGDISFQQKCLKRIRSLLDTGTSIIFVSHNFYLVQAVCNKALYLEKGQVRHIGDTKSVIDMYEQDLHLQRAQKFRAAGKEEENEDADVEITSVEVFGTAPQATDTLSSRQPAEIRVHYNAYRPLGNVHVSVFIQRSDGLTSCMMRTKLDEFPLSVARGRGTISVFMDPLQLTGATYFAEAWFLNESDSMALSAKPGRSDWFVVKGAAVTSLNDSTGVFEPRARWAHEHDEDEVPDAGQGTMRTPVTLAAG